MNGAEQWTAALDALEEWVRRTAAALRSRDLDLPAAPPPLPSGPVPAVLGVRALAVLARLQATETVGLRRREQLAREAAYGAA